MHIHESQAMMKAMLTGRLHLLDKRGPKGLPEMLPAPWGAWEHQHAFHEGRLRDNPTVKRGKEENTLFIRQ